MAEPLDIFQFMQVKQAVEGSGVPADVAALTPAETDRIPATPQVRGDDLIGRALAISAPTDEDVATARLFQKSRDLVKTRAMEDEVFAKSVLPKLQGLKGEQFYEGVVNAADDIQIEQLIKTDPKFTSEEAQVTAFLNSATFGQMTRIIGGIASAVPEEWGGRSYEDVVTEQAEYARLLQKAFPNSDLVGQAASFLIPGSPVKMLFTKAASLGTKFARPLIEKITQNPKLLAKIGKKLGSVAQTAAESSAAGAAGAGTVGATAGFLGEGMDDAFQFDRGADQGIAHGVYGGTLGALIPAGFAGVGEVVTRAAPVVRSGARAIGQTVARAGGQVSGVDPAVLRLARRNPEALRGAQSAKQIGDDLVAHLQSEFGQLPEVQAAKELLPQMGRIPIKPLLAELQSIRRSIDPQQKGELATLNEWVANIKNQAKRSGRGRFEPQDGSISAEKMWEMKESLQNSSKVAFGEKQGLLGERLKAASRQARMSLETQAERLGVQTEAGATYVGLMRKAAEKRRVLDYVGRKLGKNIDTQAERSEAFISNLFGKNKGYLEGRLGQLDSLYGTKFLERARLSNMASGLENGNLPLLPQHSTGKTLFGTLAGNALGGAAGLLLGGPAAGVAGGMMGAVGLAASSPKIAARAIGSSDAITGFVRRLFANPGALERMAGRVSKSASGKPDITAAKQLAALRLPEEIQTLAREVQTALVKDGPISAASTLRVIADTPYFVGFVHYFEMHDREQRLAEARKSIEQNQGPQAPATSPEIAVQPGQVVR